MSATTTWGGLATDVVRSRVKCYAMWAGGYNGIVPEAFFRNSGKRVTGGLRSG
jgi:hypothetical protein